ncbi:MAG: dienelactone hydrolase family protein [Thermoleophilia bacterium]|nr:dienelactone hydrolase family protein [Thermoleophilia bacterium]
MAAPAKDFREEEHPVNVDAGPVSLEGTLAVPSGAKGVVLFAHGSGSSRRSPRNRYVAGELYGAGLGTLLMDLLTSDEEAVDMFTGRLRFNIELLAARLAGATDWLAEYHETRGLIVGYFGASTGAAAALVAATQKQERIGAIVSRGGRPDLAGTVLDQVGAPTLLIVGGEDTVVIGLNEEARAKMTATCEMRIVPGATHLFEEPGALEEVARLAAAWFARYLGTADIQPRAADRSAG